VEGRVDENLMREAIRLSVEAIETNAGGPFGAVVSRNGQVVGRGWNQVTSANDPTAHAEVMAIRDACRRLGTFDLSGCEVFASCEPCPMCLAAAYWARIKRIWYANTREEAASIGFDDARIAEELRKPVGSRSVPMQRLLADEAREAFRLWAAKPDRVPY
jgi:tRNA(Arg) A34 adenosine deaminase TadA